MPWNLITIQLFVSTFIVATVLTDGMFWMYQATKTGGRRISRSNRLFLTPVLFLQIYTWRLTILIAIVKAQKIAQRYSLSYQRRRVSVSALVSTTLYRFGGARTERMRGRDVGGSRKLFFLDANHPEEWTKGPKTIAGRYMAATAIFGKLFVFGGCLPNNGVWAEVLDTARAGDADNGGWRWSPLPGGGQCPSDVLGVEELFAIAIYHEELTLRVIPIADTEICELLHATWKWDAGEGRMNPNFIHHIFCLVWVGDCLVWVGDDEHLHTTTLTTTLKVSATMTSVLCCHIYSFQEQDDQEQDDQDDCFVAGNIELVKCLQPSLQM